MASIPSWVEIPRADVDVHGTYRLPIGFRVGFALSTVLSLGLGIGLTWFASSAPELNVQAVLYVLAAIVGVIGVYGLSVVATFGSHIETNPEEIRYHRPFGGIAAVPWRLIESIRVRRYLKRIELNSSVLARPIRLELQLDRIETLLMVLAERTQQLLDASPTIAMVLDATGVPRESGKRASGIRWSIEEDGLAALGAQIGFADITDLRIARVGSVEQGHLGLTVQFRDGTVIAIHLGAEGLVERYQRARRAHRSWVARNDALVAEPMPIPTERPASMGRRVLVALVSIAATFVLAFVTAAVRNPEFLSRMWRGEPERAVVARGVELFRSNRYEEVVELAEAHFADHEPAPENVVLLHVQALSYRKLQRTEAAIEAYERGVPVVRRLDDISAEPHGRLFYELAALYHARGDAHEAIKTLDEGLKIRPRSIAHRALLAAWYQDLGLHERAGRLFGELLEAAPQGSEPHAVAMRRFGPGSARSVETKPAMPWSRAELAREMAIAIVPINDVDPRLDLTAVCLVLEFKLWIPCTVIPSQTLSEEHILDVARSQYDTGRLIPILHAGISKIAPRFLAPEEGIFLLGVTSRDLFSGEANFVFSSSSDEARVAVVSSHRLLDDLPSYWSPEALAGRRMSIQALSAVGAALGLERPVSDHCPLSYPNGVEAFLRKRGELCASTIEARDALLASRGGERIHQDERRIAATKRTHQKYLLE